MVGDCQRQTTSEGLLSLTVAGIFDAERNQRGGKGRGEHERASKGRGEGQGIFLEGDKEGKRGRGMEGGREMSVSPGEE